MKVDLVKCDANAEDYIVQIARVSSKRTDKTAKPEGLIRYLVKIIIGVLSNTLT